MCVFYRYAEPCMLVLHFYKVRKKKRRIKLQVFILNGCTVSGCLLDQVRAFVTF